MVSTGVTVGGTAHGLGVVSVPDRGPEVRRRQVVLVPEFGAGDTGYEDDGINGPHELID